MTEDQRATRAAECRYGGNPQHKCNPSDFGLTPPASPRPGKTLCDALAPIGRAEAQGLVAAGILKGMVSQRSSNDGWPQNVWSVSDAEVYEAQLENPSQGVYHGYPLPKDDDFRDVVLEEWKRR